MAGLYKKLFAALLARGDAHQDEVYGERKRRLFADLHGTVLEIGPGTGLNLPYYPEGVRWVGVEPNPHMHRYVKEKAAALGRQVELVTGSAQRLEVGSESVDALVSTLVLCSVPDLDATLTEIRRVLKPGGRFYFIEHVAAPEGTTLRRAQHFVKPLWRVLADGCHPDRETGRALEKAGFADVQYEAFDVETPFVIVRPHIMGTATKA